MSQKKKFPKTLTIELPELERMSLQVINQRDPDRSPAELVERLLAKGIYDRLTWLEDGPEQGLKQPSFVEAGDLPETVVVRPSIALAPREQEQWRRCIRSDRETHGEFLISMLKLGLHAYSRNLKIVEPEDTSSDEGDQ